MCSRESTYRQVPRASAVSSRAWEGDTAEADAAQEPTYQVTHHNVEVEVDVEVAPQVMHPRSRWCRMAKCASVLTVAS
jgi:hypothetical protein